MEKEIKITYNWSRDDGKDIDKEHEEALEESAQERIFEMIKEGYRGGELNDRIRMNDKDGEDGVGYSGWWSLLISTL